MKLLINIQADHTRLSLVEDEDAEFYVPAGWKGEYYPSYIPEGFQIVEIGDSNCFVTLYNSMGKYVHFVEMDEVYILGVDSEAGAHYDISVNGLQALCIDKGECQKISWSNGERYFLITTNIGVDKCIDVASSVKN